jgi:DNA-binding response OmpR family regulator
MPRAVDLADAARRIARIALVDDDPMFLRMFAANLQAAGYQTVCFDDPNQALASLQRDAPLDAYVLDWNMPGLDGLALPAQFRTARSGLCSVAELSRLWLSLASAWVTRRPARSAA